MELRVDYSRNIQGQEQLAMQVEAVARKLGHACMLSPMLCEGEGDYPTMEMFVDGAYALGSSFEIERALSDGSIEAFLRSETQ